MLDMLPQETQPKLKPLQWLPRSRTPYAPSRESVEIIRDARRIIRWRWRWTTGTEARNILGFDVEPESRWAVRFCARGAVYRIARKRGFSDHHRFVVEALRLLHYGMPVEDLNDIAGHRAVLDRMDYVIAHC